MLESHLKSALVVSQSFVERSARRGARRRQHRQHLVDLRRRLARSVGLRLSPPRRRGVFQAVGYSVAKSGMLNFTRWLAEYCAPFGIRVNTLVPGGVREAEHAPEFVAEYEKRTPLGRMAIGRRLQRRDRVSGVAGVGVHDRRDARRRRRLDRSLSRLNGARWSDCRRPADCPDDL